MINNCSCGSKHGKCIQRFPKNCKLEKNMDLTFENLERRLLDSGYEKNEVFMHKMTTIHLKNGIFTQTGSGPNFQGGVITQCTCKKYRRTQKTRDDWENRWIAGFTDIKHTGDNYLFYLMKMENTYESQKDIFDNLGNDIVKKKNSRYHKCGDIFEPKQELTEKYNYRHYYEPIDGHPHKIGGQWHEDILYKGKPHFLLAGIKDYSFLWSKPLIGTNIRANWNSREKKAKNIEEFLFNITSR